MVDTFPLVYHIRPDLEMDAVVQLETDGPSEVSYDSFLDTA
jgi:hypothetical protein